ncbi:hypothetical protein GCM10010232_11810 [Streptomyces amakusaensis]
MPTRPELLDLVREQGAGVRPLTSGMKKVTRNRPEPHIAALRWRKADLALLNALMAAETALPRDAPRALLSIRLSTLTSAGSRISTP